MGHLVGHTSLGGRDRVPLEGGGVLGWEEERSELQGPVLNVHNQTILAI